MAKATTVKLTGTGNTVTAAQALTLVGKQNFALDTGATLVVGDTAANLLLTANSAGVAKATTVKVTGTGPSNEVTAAQAVALAAKPLFAVDNGATLVVKDTAANILSASNVPGVSKATSVKLTGTANSLTVALATTLAGKASGNVTLDTGATLVIADSSANILDAANSNGVAKATTVQVTGTANTAVYNTHLREQHTATQIW